jgi:phosphate transport system permease protein
MANAKEIMRKNNLEQTIGFITLFCSIALTISFLGAMMFFIVKGGWKVVSWELLTAEPRAAMTKGGVAPAIIGTTYLTLGSVLFSLPLALACAIYLCEYAKGGWVVNMIRMSINNLAGVPSVVFGLFGFAVFVNYFGFGVSILSGCLTLGILILPNIISSTQEALLAVPQSYREASLALGATQWQTIRNVVLPNAMPGILTGIILSIGRVAGETAPILFTAGTFYMRGYPDSPFSKCMALPYHIYALMTEGTHPEEQKQIAYACALILLILVLFISLIAIIIRERFRRRYEN